MPPTCGFRTKKRGSRLLISFSETDYYTGAAANPFPKKHRKPLVMLRRFQYNDMQRSTGGGALFLCRRREEENP